MVLLLGNHGLQLPDLLKTSSIDRWLILRIGRVAMPRKVIRVREWERAKFVAEQCVQFYASPEIRRILDVLDDHKPYDRRYNDLLLNALTTNTAHQFSAEEQTLREGFNIFLNALEQFERYIVVGLCTADDLKPYLLSWIQIIASKDFTRKNLRFYRQLVNYIDYFNYTGVQSLFNRFKCPIPPYGGFRFAVDTVKPGMAAGYNPDHAVGLAQASALAYETPAYIGLVVREEWGFTGYKFLEGKTFQRDRVNTQGFLAWRDDVILLAFRGTQQIADWLTNVKRDLEPLTVPNRVDQTARGKVHRGFQNAWLSVAGEVVKYIDLLERQRPRPLYITGHSLGGALAAMATAHLLAKGKSVTALYNFGQPRIGDAEFVDWFDDRFKKSYFRYVNRNDIVPRVPMSVIPRYIGWRPFYRHAGNLMYLDTRGNLQERVTIGEIISGQVKALSENGISWIGDHDMSRYTRFVRRTAKQYDSLPQVSQYAGSTFTIQQAGDEAELSPSS